MIGLVEAPRAYWMAQGMARTAGVHLARAVVEGWMTRQDLAQLVGRCQCCGSSADCEAWLSQARSGPPPAFCAIGTEIAAISEQG